MKTSELTKKIREIGYECTLSECYIKVFLNERDLKEDEHYFIVNINQTIEGIRIRNGMSISSNMSRSLVRLILDYLDTPKLEREEEKKYWLIFPKGIVQRKAIFKGESVDILSTKPFKTSYTQKEIDAMPFDTNFFIKEEVQ